MTGYKEPPEGIKITTETSKENGSKGGKKKAENAKERKEEAKQLAMTKEAIAGGLELLLTKAKKKAKTQEQLDKIEQLEAINNPIVSLILDIAFNPETKDKDKLSAADMLIDRLEGKPTQSIVTTGSKSIIREKVAVTQAEIDEVGAEMDKEFDEED